MVYVLGAIDCGITTLGWCNTPTCQKLGTVKAFLTVLILVGIVQGAAEKFVSISVEQAALEHDYNPDVVGLYSFRILSLLVFLIGGALSTQYLICLTFDFNAK